MAMIEVVGDLLDVIEIGGTARCGKGTGVEFLSKVHPEVAIDETGADYRTATYGLLQEGVIEFGMTPQAVARAIGTRSIAALTDLVARRKEIEQELGEEGFTTALYGEEVGGTVQDVAVIPNVRKAVKAGFKKRIEKVRDDQEHRVLVVDGRNLAPVVSSVEGTRLVMRMFMFCNPLEAARRECKRAKLTEGTEEWDHHFNESYRSIVKRNDADAGREIDPVRPDPDAIDYWNSTSLIDATSDVYSRFLFNGDEGKAKQAIFSGTRSLTGIPRIGAGTKAVAEGRQIYFDTTDFVEYANPVHAMQVAINNMFEEAMAAQLILEDRQ